MQCRSPQRCDQADGTRLRGDVLLARWFKQAFCLKRGFELEKLGEQIALPSPLHAVDNQLQVASGFVNAQFAANFNQLAIARYKAQSTGGPFEHGTAYLPAVVFEIEITMATGCARKARNFALDRNRIEARIQSVCNCKAQSTNRPNTWLRIYAHDKKALFFAGFRSISTAKPLISIRNSPQFRISKAVH